MYVDQVMELSWWGVFFNWEVLSKTNEVPWKLMKVDKMTEMMLSQKKICWKWRVKAWMIHHHLADSQVDLHYFQLKQWIPRGSKKYEIMLKRITHTHTYSIILKTTAVANPEIKHKHKHRHTPRNSIIPICIWETKTTCIHKGKVSTSYVTHRIKPIILSPSLPVVQWSRQSTCATMAPCPSK